MLSVGLLWLESYLLVIKSKRNFVLLPWEGAQPKGVKWHDYLTNDNSFAPLVTVIDFLVKYVNL